MARKTWTWNKFYGGLADYSNMLTAEDSTKYGNESFSVDGRREPHGVQLGPYITTGEYVVSGDITAYLDLAEFGGSGIVAITDTGNVYLNGTLKHTFTGSFSTDLRGMGVLNGTLYIFTPYKIHRSNFAITTVTADIISTVNTGSTTMAFYNIYNTIYFSNGQALHKLDATETPTYNLLQLGAAYTITGLTFFQDFMRVYASSAVSGKLVLWNLDPSSLGTPVPFPGLPVRGVDGEGGVDWAVMGYNDDYSDLYEISGTSSPRLLVSNTEGGISPRKFNGIIRKRLGMAYLGGEIRGLNGVNSKCIFSYGSYHKNFPLSLQVEGKTGEVTAIYTKSNQILFGNDVSGSKRSGIIYIGNNSGVNKYAANGDVVSNIFTGGTRALKTIIGAHVYFDSDLSDFYNKYGGIAKLYYRKKSSTAWTLIREIDTTAITDGVVWLSKTEFKNGGYFNQLEYKLTLEASSSQEGAGLNISPMITAVVTDYDDGIKDS